MNLLTLEKQKSLAELTTFGIGGPARFFTKIHTMHELQEALSFAHTEGIPYLPLGKGSNTLFDDRGYNGLVMLMKLEKIEILDAKVIAESGASFSLLGAKTARYRLSGLEFASGIPGSVGGAVYMNAGANGVETKDCLTQVDFLHENGEIESFTDLSFSYRTSPFQSMKGVIVCAHFALTPSQEAKAKQCEIISYRKETQPLAAQSAGCIFQNPNEHSAGSLIERAGLKGARIGGAMVSEQHANFIVNAGGATAADIEALIAFVRDRVLESCGIILHDEVRRIPYE